MMTSWRQGVVSAGVVMLESAQAIVLAGRLDAGHAGLG